ncbi:MAG: hypothetical protein Q9223_005242 [Gallowayella weberi]
MTSTTRNRFGNFGSGTTIAAADQSRSSHGSSLPHPFVNSSTTWNAGIWGNNTAIGSGLKNSTNDNSRSQVGQLEWTSEASVAISGQYIARLVEYKYKAKWYISNAAPE